MKVKSGQVLCLNHTFPSLGINSINDFFSVAYSTLFMNRVGGENNKNYFILVTIFFSAEFELKYGLDVSTHSNIIVCDMRKTH